MKKRVYPDYHTVITVGDLARTILSGMSREQRLLALVRVCEEINRRKHAKLTKKRH